MSLAGNHMEVSREEAAIVAVMFLAEPLAARFCIPHGMCILCEMGLQVIILYPVLQERRVVKPVMSIILADLKKSRLPGRRREIERRGICKLCIVCQVRVRGGALSLGQEKTMCKLSQSQYGKFAVPLLPRCRAAPHHVTVQQQ